MGILAALSFGIVSIKWMATSSRSSAKLTPRKSFLEIPMRNSSYLSCFATLTRTGIGKVNSTFPPLLVVLAQ